MPHDPKVLETLEALNRGYLLASELDALRELNRGYIRSVQESEVPWFDEHLAEDFVNSNPDCSFVDRIRARTTYVKPDGQPGAGRYTDVWARRGGRWLCVAANVSRG